MKKIRDVLSRKSADVATVSAGTTIREAVRTMADKKIGSVLVVENEHLKGIFTERDLMSRVVAAGVDLDAAPVDEVMSKDLITCSQDDTIEEVSRIMSNARHRHIPVIEGKQLVGIVTSGDIMASVLEDRTIEVGQLKSYIQGDLAT